MEHNTRKCCCNQNEDLKAFLKKVQEIKDSGGTKLMCLQEAQVKFGFLSTEVMTMIADVFGISTSDIYSVASFYSQFRFVKQGKYRISLCLGTACYVKGANVVLKKLEDELHIKLGETTPDQKFTLDSARCVGCCGLAPVMLINDKVYPIVTPDKVPGILKEYENK